MPVLACWLCSCWPGELDGLSEWAMCGEHLPPNPCCCLFSLGNVGAYPEIVFLGTGSAIPMKIRNVSSTLLNTR